jgi:hypothetical protein
MSSALAAYETLLALAQRQAEALDADDVDLFLELADQRDAATRSLNPPGDPVARQCAAALLKTTMCLDEAIVARVADGLARTRAEIDQVRAGRRAVRLYRVPNHARGTGASA